MPYLAGEISCWASPDEQLLGLVARDRADDGYSWMALACDRNGGFRCANLMTDYPTAPRAEEALLEEIDRIIRKRDVKSYGVQGDETNAPLDFLHVLIEFSPDKLHSYSG